MDGNQYVPEKDLYDQYDTPPRDGGHDQVAQNMRQEVYQPGTQSIRIPHDQLPQHGDLVINIRNENININGRNDQCVPGRDGGPNYQQYCQPYQNWQPNYREYNYRPQVVDYRGAEVMPYQQYRQPAVYDYNSVSSGRGGLRFNSGQWNGGGAQYYAQPQYYAGGGAQYYAGGGAQYYAGGDPNYNGGATDYQWAGMGVGAGLTVLQDVLGYNSQRQYYNTMQNRGGGRAWR